MTPDVFNYKGIGGGGYTPPACIQRYSPSLDSGKFILNYRGPNVTFNIGTANQFSSKGNFWTGLWNGLTGYNNFGMKTGFGIFDLGFAFLANKLFGGNRAGGAYNAGSFWSNPSLGNADTFNRQHSYIQQPPKAAPTEKPEEEKKETNVEKKEEPKVEKKTTVTPKTAAPEEKKAAASFKAAIVKGSHFDGANMTAKGVNSINGNIVAVGDIDSTTGLPKSFTVLDKQINTAGNSYTLSLVEVDKSGIPTYKITSATKDGASIINPNANNDDLSYKLELDGANLIGRKYTESEVTTYKLGDTTRK